MNAKRLAEIRAYAESGKPGHMNYDMVRQLLAHMAELEASRERLREALYVFATNYHQDGYDAWLAGVIKMGYLQPGDLGEAP